MLERRLNKMKSCDCAEINNSSVCSRLHIDTMTQDSRIPYDNYLEIYKKYYSKCGPYDERFGQHLCNTFGIHDTKLFYETNSWAAASYFINGYVKGFLGPDGK